MTAIIVVSQPDRVHIATDAAIYRGGDVVAFGNKVTTIPHLNCAVTCAGNAAAAPLFGWSMARNFTDFDDMIDRLPVELPSIAEAFGLPSGAVVIAAGISQSRGPEAWNFCLDDAVPPTNTRKEMEASPYHGRPFKLVRLPAHGNTPVPPHEVVIAANWEGFDVNADEASVIWSMRKLMAMQRVTPLPQGIGGIGGFAEITTISAEGITQRIVDRWSDDKVGAPLRHDPIDWAKWHRENPKPAAAKKERRLKLVKA